MSNLVPVEQEPNQDVDDFLAHFGVPGMKWGRRKAAYQSLGSTGRERQAAAAQQAVDRSGGSKAKAAAKVAGRTLAADILVRAATLGVGSAIKSPSAKIGLQAVSSGLLIANTVAGVRDTVSVAKSQGSKSS